ncbi:hypothetical protein VT84_21405 [Gemmata sp. SH-PL17]|nr:hypothetical protein VT84_21405 [Gemmata sp. SH-PL17]
MTEAEWLVCEASRTMLEFAQDRASARQLRLFAVACGRLVSHYQSYPQADSVFGLSEEYADRKVDGTALRAARERARVDIEGVLSVNESVMRNTIRAAELTTEDDAAWAAEGVLGYVRVMLGPISEWTLSRLARDIFGNPFRTVSFSPAWRTSMAVALAGQMYESRDFSAMPILADALQDAGCDDANVLDHCRDTNAPHVRGCWLVDLVLGKE